MKNKLILMLCTISCLPTTSSALKPMQDEEIRKIIVDGNLSTYQNIKCPCPFSRDAKGNECGVTSQYVINRGSIQCYPEDVSQNEVLNYRQKFGIPDPKQPWLSYPGGQ